MNFFSKSVGRNRPGQLDRAETLLHGPANKKALKFKALKKAPESLFLAGAPPLHSPPAYVSLLPGARPTCMACFAVCLQSRLWTHWTSRRKRTARIRRRRKRAGSGPARTSSSHPKRSGRSSRSPRPKSRGRNGEHRLVDPVREAVHRKQTMQAAAARTWGSLLPTSRA